MASDEAVALGRQPGFADMAIAALAQNAGQMLLTRNLKHFQYLGVACIDPMVQLPFDENPDRRSQAGA